MSYVIMGLGLIYWVFIRIMEKNMEITTGITFYRGCMSHRPNS